MNLQVPFLDLRVQHDPLMPELIDAFCQVTEASAFAGGPFVARFEAEFAAFCRARYALGVGSGTDALWLSLLSLGVGQGDEVITAPNSFMATAEAISICGARPVFVDIDERTYTMDPTQLSDEPRVVRPQVGAHAKHVFHIYAVRVKDRDGVLRRMAESGVNCAVHYPVPIHLQEAYGFLGLGPGCFPVAERCAREILSLPIYPELRAEDIELVVEVLKNCLRD